MTRSFSGGALWARWHGLWFTQVPPHVYAVLRVLFGVMGLTDLLGTTPVATYWDLDGLAPLPGGGLGVRQWLAASGAAPVVARALFTCTAAAFVAMAAGILPQVSVIAAFVLSVTQSVWNPLPLSSAHQVLTVMLFPLALADCGQALTLWPAAPVHPQPRAVWPLRLMRLQLCLVYLNSGLWKFYSPMWRDGSALHYALSTNLFARFPFDVPVVLYPLTVFGTYATLLWEIGFAPLYLWRRTRAIALGLGLLFHIGVWMTMEVGPFSWMMLAAYPAVLDPDRVAALVGGVQARFGRGVSSAGD